MTDAARAQAGWQWRLMAAILIGMGVGFGVAWLLGFGERGIQAAIVSGLTLASGSSGRLRTALPVACLLGGIVVVFSTIGAVTTGHPGLAAAAMAAVAFSTSIMAAAQPVGLLVALVASNAYFLVTGVGVLAAKTIGGDLGEIGVLGAPRPGDRPAAGHHPGPGRAGNRKRPARTRPRTCPRPPGAMKASLLSFDDHAKDGVRRALALGLAMLAFQYYASHNAFWVMLTVFVILGPKGRPTLAIAARRVAGTVLGVFAVTAVASFVPTGFAAALGVLALAASLASSSRSTTVSAALAPRRRPS